MPFCAAAALLHGRVGLDTFAPAVVHDARIADLLPRITMAVDTTLRSDAPALTQARVTIRLRGGRTLSAYADGARGYPARPATAQELTDKFRACAGRVLDPARTDAAIAMLRSLDELAETRTLTSCLNPAA
jgi:2-methylcitrate dehydratase PrpD